jgi:altronate hydrolase
VKNNALRINGGDNVIIATRSISEGEQLVVQGQPLFAAAQDIEAGHKIAVVPIHAGESVIRYGEPIVQATQTIARGEWVHVHNTRPVPGDLKQ